MHPKTMRRVFFVSNLCTLSVTWLLLRYCTARSSVFPKRDVLEHVHAQLKVGRLYATSAGLESAIIFPANGVESASLRTTGNKGVQESTGSIEIRKRPAARGAKVNNSRVLLQIVKQ